MLLHLKLRKECRKLLLNLIKDLFNCLVFAVPAEKKGNFYLVAKLVKHPVKFTALFNPRRGYLYHKYTVDSE